MEKINAEDRVREYAIENYKRGLNCSESVMEALIREGCLDLPRELIGMCVGFGGGIGLRGATCGALSAAVLANGIAYGRRDPYEVPETDRAKEIAAKYYRRYHALVGEFIRQHGHTGCADICSAYGAWESKERRVHCLRLIGETAVLAYRFLQLSQEEAFQLPYEGKTMKEFDGRDPETMPEK